MSSLYTRSSILPTLIENDDDDDEDYYYENYNNNNNNNNNNVKASVDVVNTNKNNNIGDYVNAIKTKALNNHNNNYNSKINVFYTKSTTKTYTNNNSKLKLELLSTNTIKINNNDNNNSKQNFNNQKNFRYTYSTFSRNLTNNNSINNNIHKNNNSSSASSNSSNISDCSSSNFNSSLLKNLNYYDLPTVDDFYDDDDDDEDDENYEYDDDDFDNDDDNDNNENLDTSTLDNSYAKYDKKYFINMDTTQLDSKNVSLGIKKRAKSTKSATKKRLNISKPKTAPVETAKTTDDLVANITTNIANENVNNNNNNNENDNFNNAQTVSKKSLLEELIKTPDDENLNDSSRTLINESVVVNENSNVSNQTLTNTNDDDDKKLGNSTTSTNIEISDVNTTLNSTLNETNKSNSTSLDTSSHTVEINVKNNNNNNNNIKTKPIIKSAKSANTKRVKSSIIPGCKDTSNGNKTDTTNTLLFKRDDVSRQLAKIQTPQSNSAGNLSKFEIQQQQQQQGGSNSRLLIRRQNTAVRVRPALNEIGLRSVCCYRNLMSSLSSQGNSLSNIESGGKVPITVDTSKANSNLEVVRLCINELGWLECPNGSPTGCDIYWHSSTYHEGYHSNKFIYNHTGRINKFPCMNQLLRKGPLTLALNVMRSIYPEQYDFYPRTWFLPEQFEDFKTDCKYIHEKQSKIGKPLTTFIVKPNDGSQGEGIYLIKDPNEYIQMQVSSPKNMSRSYIVQEYIDNPYLIDGLKSDLRIYVVLSSLKPLEIHICDEGLVRFATVNYESPDDSNLKQIFMHLTNYSLNKKNESYKFTKEATNSNSESTTSESNNSESNKTNVSDSASHGSKRKLTTVFAQMEKNGIKTRRLRNAIDELVIKTIFALMPEMKVENAYELLPCQVNNVGPSCFQIFGFDILLTSELKPMLLEVNCNPSLRIDYELEGPNGQIVCLPSPIDYEIKKPLVLQTLKLIAPQKKLNLIEKCKEQEEQEERAARIRDHLAKERLKERSKQAQQLIHGRKIDLDKCPLLSKPAKEFEKKPIKTSFYSQLTSSSASFNDPLHINSSQTTSIVFNGNDDEQFTNSNETNNNELSNNIIQNNNSLVSSSYFDSFELNVNSFSTFNRINSISNATDATVNDANATTNTKNSNKKSHLRKLFPLDRTKTQYSFLNILENIADIFSYMTLCRATKVMNQAAFRAYVKKCFLITEKTSSDNLDIIFQDAQKRWSRYNRRKDVSSGLCFQGFIELFIKLSKLNYPEYALEESLKSMIYHCVYFLKIDGFKGNENCVLSRNGPILNVDERVMNKIRQIDEIRQNEAKLTKSFSSVPVKFEIDLNVINNLLANTTVAPAIQTTTSNTSLVIPQINRELSTTQKVKSKKSLFPIYYESI